MTAQLVQPNAPTAPTRSRWRQPGDLLLAPDDDRVEQIVDHIQREPLLQGWLLTAAGQPADARRHLLALIAEDLATARPDAALEWVFDSMADETVHEAVVEEVFRRGGFDPEGEGAWRGQAARCKLAHVDESLADLESSLLAEAVK